MKNEKLEKLVADLVEEFVDFEAEIHKKYIDAYVTIFLSDKPVDIKQDVMERVDNWYQEYINRGKALLIQIAETKAWQIEREQNDK